MILYKKNYTLYRPIQPQIQAQYAYIRVVYQADFSYIYDIKNIFSDTDDCVGLWCMNGFSFMSILMKKVIWNSFPTLKLMFNLLL